MHSPLEQYLEDVSTHLSALPPARRNDELQEVRQHLQHLQNAVIVNREMGQTEAEAAANAVAQFGPSVTLGSNIVWAWRREQSRRRRSFWGAAACAAVLSFLLPRCWEAMDRYFVTPLCLQFVPNTSVLWDHYVLTSDFIVFAVHALAGGISGVVFRRRAVAGTALAVAVWYGVPTLRVYTGAEWVYQPAVWVADYAGFALLAILAAWVGSHWRGRELAPAQPGGEERR